MKRPFIKKTIIAINIAAIILAIFMLTSCGASKACEGSAKMIGYGTSTKNVIKNNR